MLDGFVVSTVSPEDLIVTFPAGGRASAQTLLDALMDRLAEQDASTSAVTLGLDEYMALCGLDDRQKARTQAGEDLEVIFGADITCKAVKGKQKPYLHTRLLSAKGILSDQIVAVFGSTFRAAALECPADVRKRLRING